MVKAFGKTEEWLRDGGGDDVSKWKGIKVAKEEEMRVKEVFWDGESLFGTMPREIKTPSLAKLSALRTLNIFNNKGFSGELHPVLGKLKSLTKLCLHKNSFSGPVPSTLANLTNLHTIYLYENNLTNDVPPSGITNDKGKVQGYLTTLRSFYLAPAPP